MNFADELKIEPGGSYTLAVQFLIFEIRDNSCWLGEIVDAIHKVQTREMSESEILSIGDSYCLIGDSYSVDIDNDIITIKNTYSLEKVLLSPVYVLVLFSSYLAYLKSKTCVPPTREH